MFERNYKLRAKVWVYDGPASWCFVTIPKKQSEKIRGLFAITKRGFGSLPVRVTVGKTIWKTSIFSDSPKVSVLPLKADVKRAEAIANRKTMHTSLEVLGHGGPSL